MKLLPILKVNVLRHVFYLLMPLKHLIEFVILIFSMFVKAQHVCSYKKIAYDVIANYSMLDSFSRCKVHTSFCMSLYGSELWIYKSRYVEEIVVAWRKTVRMLFRLPYRTHNILSGTLLRIDLFLRPCLCYQLQSIEQNMYVLL